MKMKHKSGLFCLVMILVIGIYPASGGDAIRNPLLNLNLTPEQILKLQDLFEAYGAKQLELRGEMDTKLTELKMELRKKDRFKNKIKEVNAVYRANELVKKIGKLYGELFKTNAVYLLKAKNVLTKNQREKLFAGLREFEFNIPDDMFVITEEDLLRIDLGLSVDQMKKILGHHANMKKKAIDLDLKIDLKLIDLQLETEKEERDVQKIDQLILSVTDLGAKLIDNRIKQLLKAKDVLTVEQKNKLLHILLMQPGY